MHVMAFVLSGKLWVRRWSISVVPVIPLALLLYAGCGGNSSPTPPPPPPPPPQIQVYSGTGYPFTADFNLDGKPDVLTAPTFGESSGSMNLGAGNGDFQAATHVPLPTGFYVQAIGDFNGDGKPDLLATNCAPGLTCGSTPIDVFLGNGDGTFQQAPISTTATLQNLVVADLNGDRKTDVAGLFNGTLSVYVSNGDGTFTAGASYNFTVVNPGPVDMALGDFNSDHKTDVVVFTPGDFGSEGQWIVFLGNGDGTFQAVVNPGGSTTLSVAVADFNRDGKSDLAMSACGFITGCVTSAALGNGDGTFQGGSTFGPNTGSDGGSVVGAADFNGDGKADLIVQGDPLMWDTADIYLSNGDGTFTKTNSYAVGARATQNTPGIAIADFNGDGKPDIAVANTVLLSNGDGTFQSKPR